MGYSLPAYNLFHICRTVSVLKFIRKLGAIFSKLQRRDKVKGAYMALGGSRAVSAFS